MARKATIKQKRFVKAYIESGSAKRAALSAYDVSDKNAAMFGYTVLKQDNVKNLIQIALEKEGLTDDLISQKLHKIVDAGTSDSALAVAKVSDAHKAIQELNKIKGNYAAEKKQVETKSTRLNMDLKGKTPEELQKALEDLSDELLTFKRMVAGTRKSDLPITEGEVVTTERREV